MSFKLSPRKASEVQVDDLVMCRDGRRRFVANVIVDKLSASVHIHYVGGDMTTVAALWSDVEIATWFDNEEAT